MEIENLLRNFMKSIENNEVDVYNEFSLQHELGCFLRNELKDKGYKVEFERNVSFFGIDKKDVTKREIDIVIYKDTKKPECAIELKFPRNGQVPESMFSFIKDIKFMEELKNKCFSNTYCLALVDNKNFYSGSCKDNTIYQYFRKKGKKINGDIFKPTGKDKNKKITINGDYEILWKCWGSDKESNKRKYYILEIK